MSLHPFMVDGEPTSLSGDFAKLRQDMTNTLQSFHNLVLGLRETVETESASIKSTLGALEASINKIQSTQKGQ